MNWIEQKTLGLFVKTGGVLSKPLLGGMGSIFCLHRVLPKKETEGLLFKPLSLSISCEKLEEIIAYYKAKKYDFISMDEVSERLKSGKKPANKFVSFTIDDGYWDNYTYAWPIFEKHQIPFTIYITTSFPNHALNLWWYNLEELLSNTSSVEMPEYQKSINVSTPELKLEAFFTLRKWIIEAESKTEQDKRIASILAIEKYGNWSKKAGPLKWSQIIELSNNSLVTIGAHTLNHLALSKLNEQDALNEMCMSKLNLETTLAKPVLHFAYPFGSKNECAEREFSLAKKAGYKTAVTLNQGNIRIQNKSNLFALPRIPLGDHYDTKKLDSLVNGIHHFAYNGFKKA